MKVLDQVREDQVERDGVVLLEKRILRRERLAQQVEHAANPLCFLRLGVELLVLSVHRLEPGVLHVRGLTLELELGHLRGHVVVVAALVGEVATAKERVLGQVTHEELHLPGHRIADLRGAQGRAVLQPDEHLLDFLVGRLELDHAERIAREGHPRLRRQLFVPAATNVDAVDHELDILRERVLAIEELPDRTEALLPIDDLELVHRRFPVMAFEGPQVELRDVHATKDGVDEQLLLLSRPDRTTLVLRLRVDPILHLVRHIGRPWLLIGLQVCLPATAAKQRGRTEAAA